MLKLLLVSRDKGSLNGLLSALNRQDEIEFEVSTSGEKALAMISDKPVDLVVADEDLGDMTGLELVRRLLKINAMINSAVVSDLSHDEFHEISEGLGVMTHLPKKPDEKDAEALIKELRQIKGLLN
jgi:DNA-binding response OmpR family regulator